MRALTRALERYRGLIGRFAFELVIVFVGVSAAFAVDAARERAEENAYRQSMISALVPTFDDVLRHNALFEHDVSSKLRQFDAAIARRERPRLPVFLESGSERPPTGAWTGVVATGAARALDPAMYFQLSLFYARQDSWGERYVRYAGLHRRPCSRAATG